MATNNASKPRKPQPKPPDRNKLKTLKQLQQPVVVDELASVIYQRKDESEVLVPIKQVKPVTKWKAATSGEVVRQSEQCLSLHWNVPGQRGQEERGVLTKLVNTQVTVINTGPFTLFFRCFRPYGFREDPLGIAHWESLWAGKGEARLEPQQSHSFVVHHHSTDQVVPRRQFVKGFDTVHFLSMAFNRDEVANSGAIVKAEQQDDVCFRVVLSTLYDSDGNSTGTSSPYSMVLYEDTSSMSKVNISPVSNVTLGQLSLSLGQVEYATLEGVMLYNDTSASKPPPTKGLNCVARLKFWSGDAFEFRTDSLDEGVVYCMDSPILSLGYNYSDSVIRLQVGSSRLSTCRYLRYISTDFTFDANTKGNIKWHVDGANYPGWYLFNQPFSKQWSKGLAFFESVNNTLDITDDWHPLVPNIESPGRIGGSTALSAMVGMDLPSLNTGPVKLKHLGRLVPPKHVVSRFATDLQAETFWASLIEGVSLVVKALQTALSVAAVLGLAVETPSNVLNTFTEDGPRNEHSEFVVV